MVARVIAAEVFEKFDKILKGVRRLRLSDSRVARPSFLGYCFVRLREGSALGVTQQVNPDEVREDLPRLGRTCKRGTPVCWRVYLSFVPCRQPDARVHVFGLLQSHSRSASHCFLTRSGPSWRTGCKVVQKFPMGSSKRVAWRFLCCAMVELSCVVARPSMSVPSV